MKKIRNLILVLVLNIVLILICVNIPTYAYTGEITTETLRIRKEPNINSSVLGLVTTGDEVEILSEEDEWVKIKIGDITGYVSSKYVKKSDISKSNITNNTNNSTNTTIEKNTTNSVTVNNDVENSNEATNLNNTNLTQTNEKEDIKINKDDLIGEKKLTTKTKLYITPVIFSSELETLEGGIKINVVSITNGWAFIQTEKNAGWIRVDKISELNSNSDSEEQVTITDLEPQTEETQTQPISKKYVNDSIVNMRKKASTDSEVMAKLSLNTEVDIISQSGDWYQVKVNGTEGYILGSLLSDKKKEITQTTDRSLPVSRTEESYGTTADEVIGYSKQYLGCPYVYGGAGASTFDCSGFTMYVYKHFGINLPHTATGQSKLGIYVGRNELQKGDLIIFNDSANAGIGHVGIYIGDGSFIHASSGSGKVTITSLASDYYARRYVTARRVL